MWCRTVNSRGGAGSNIPADLYLEHLNRTLKDYLNGVGPNISSNAIVQTSKSLKCLPDVTTNYDRVCNIGLISIHHTNASSKEDRDKIITQLTELECLTTFLDASTIHSRVSSLTCYPT